MRAPSGTSPISLVTITARWKGADANRVPLSPSLFMTTRCSNFMHHQANQQKTWFNWLVLAIAESASFPMFSPSGLCTCSVADALPKGHIQGNLEAQICHGLHALCETPLVGQGVGTHGEHHRHRRRRLVPRARGRRHTQSKRTTRPCGPKKRSSRTCFRFRSVSTYSCLFPPLATEMLG
ncbi:hypothetical protein BJY52DRAFT_627218 [Lactarius psammicola]|nr:hypothetical protein BJY52DRAFT_627218 [Lactarius psammicola]